MDSATIERIREGMAFEASRKGPPDGFPRLPDIPAGRYVDPGYLKFVDEVQPEVVQVGF